MTYVVTDTGTDEEVGTEPTFEEAVKLIETKLLAGVPEDTDRAVLFEITAVQ